MECDIKDWNERNVENGWDRHYDHPQLPFFIEQALYWSVVGIISSRSCGEDLKISESLQPSECLATVSDSSLLY